MHASDQATNRKRVLFHRDYRTLTGGHLKLRDYFGYLRDSAAFDPFLFLTPDSARDHVWPGEALVERYDPSAADMLFIAGLDWHALAPFRGIEETMPVINLIQGMRHATPDDPRYAFLSRRAIRLCVSEAVGEALRASKRCNGPVHVIPIGVDFNEIPQRRELMHDVFIAGLKRPALARILCNLLRARGLAVDCLTVPVARPDFLSRMAVAKVAVTLPLDMEGAFLPALEAMVVGCALVCPDCIGNRGFCIDKVTAWMPDYTPEALAAAVIALLDDPPRAQALVAGAAEMAKLHSLANERRAFLNILEKIA